MDIEEVAPRVALRRFSQLAVVRGLVMARIQEVDQDLMVYKQLCCRNSYGILCRQEYDPSIHLGEDVTIDPRDGKKWAERQINWVILQVSFAIETFVQQAYIPLGSNSIGYRRRQRALLFEDQPRPRAEALEDPDSDVFPACWELAEEYETGGERKSYAP